MAMFVVIPKNPEAGAAIATAVETEFPHGYLKMPSGTWLVSSPGTSEEIADRLKITGSVERGPSAIVFSVTGYYGRAPNTIWEWLKEKMEAGAGA